MSETQLYKSVLSFMSDPDRGHNKSLEICGRLVLIVPDGHKYSVECNIGDSAEFQEPIFVTVAETSLQVWSPKQANYCLAVIGYLAKMPKMK